MRVLVVGSGGREHALVWKLARSPLLTEIHAAPGNPGIAALAECHPIRADDAEGCSASRARSTSSSSSSVPRCRWCWASRTHCGGSASWSSARARPRLGSKDRRLRKGGDGRGRGAERCSAGHPRPPCVVKEDGLAAGKGVFVCRTRRMSTRRCDPCRASAESWSRSCSRAPSSRCSRCATARARSRSSRHRTSSGRTTVTPGLTPGAWGRMRRFPVWVSTG